MSDFTGLAVISFLSLVVFSCFFYITRIAVVIYFQVLTGIVDGNSISTKHRWFMLYNSWLPFAVGAVALSALVGLALLQMAESVTDTGVKQVAYLAAFMSFVGAMGWLAGGANAYFYFRSTLRAEPD